MIRNRAAEIGDIIRLHHPVLRNYSCIVMNGRFIQKKLQLYLIIELKGAMIDEQGRILKTIGIAVIGSDI